MSLLQTNEECSKCGRKFVTCYPIKGGAELTCQLCGHSWLSKNSEWSVQNETNKVTES